MKARARTGKGHAPVQAVVASSKRHHAQHRISDQDALWVWPTEDTDHAAQEPERGREVDSLVTWDEGRYQLR